MKDNRKDPTRALAVLAAAMLLAWGLVYSPRTDADPPDRYNTLVQVGAFIERTNAERLLRKFEAEGKVAFILEKKVGGRTYYAVVRDLMPRQVVKAAAKDRAKEMDEVPVYGTVKPAEVTPGYGKRKIREDSAFKKTAPPSSEAAGTVNSVIVPTLDRTPGKSISIPYNTMLYDAPGEHGKPLGSYKSLGGGEYVTTFSGDYGIWIEKLKGYGYVPRDAVREVYYDPSVETAMEEPPTPAEDAPGYGAGKGSPEPPRVSEGTGEEVVVPLMGGEAGKSISIPDNTPVYGSTQKDAAPIGTYAGLGGGFYAKKSGRFHVLWVPTIQGYGYVSKKAAKKAMYAPKTGNDAP